MTRLLLLHTINNLNVVQAIMNHRIM